MADKDYIAARIAHRYGLEYPFLWLALQAIEKYLKAILLYNGRTAKEIKKSGHSILDAFDKVYEISDIPFDFPKNIRSFIAYLNEQGTNRYFEYPYYTFGKELFFVDRTVWYIRRYCFYMRGTLYNPGGEPIDLFALNLKKIQHPNTLKYPNRFRGKEGKRGQEGKRGRFYFFPTKRELRPLLSYKPKRENSYRLIADPPPSSCPPKIVQKFGSSEAQKLKKPKKDLVFITTVTHTQPLRSFLGRKQ